MRVGSVSDDARFDDKVVADDLPDGCLIWVSHRDRGGYGCFWFDGRPRSAHRYSYRRFIGELIDGLVIDHTCRNRACVNPDHLRQVTYRENTLAEGSLSPAKANALKTTCKRGHPLTPDNVYNCTDGSRRCRTCRLERKMRASR